MRVLLYAVALAALPGVAAAQVTCGQMQQAMRVPPPDSGPSDDPNGPLGCTKPALEMFEINKAALERAVPVTDLDEIHGAWLGDRVLSYLLGVAVQGQELLVIGPGELPDSIKVTQYWMKALSPGFHDPLWTEEGRYVGIAAEARAWHGGEGDFEADQYGGAVRYGSRVLEFERSRDLFIKTELNHFELPFGLRRDGDVLVLDGHLRDPVTRDTTPYSRSYTRVDGDAPELALGIVMAFDMSAGRYFDCLSHEISERGPFVEALAPMSVPALQSLVRQLIGGELYRDRLWQEMQATEDETARKALEDEMRGLVEAYVSMVETDAFQAQRLRITEAAEAACPGHF